MKLGWATTHDAMIGRPRTAEQLAPEISDMSWNQMFVDAIRGSNDLWKQGRGRTMALGDYPACFAEEQTNEPD